VGSQDHQPETTVKHCRQRSRRKSCLSYNDWRGSQEDEPQLQPHHLLYISRNCPKKGATAEGSGGGKVSGTDKIQPTNLYKMKPKDQESKVKTFK